ncbi:cytochrome-c oxidase, cbb3-type subunit III [Rhodovarius sp.]|uniref:cytochrome-c oxidase, cbb3-type subunit III n=1 Tax=Rhodovarius sp. TaxID=2972673 RepID=UPI0033409E45
MAQIEKDSVSGTDTTGHEWDGLRELNTPLPPWWLYTFYACIAFAAVWVVLYPALPISGATGLLGWTARGAFPAQQAADAAQREPMLARLRSTSPAAIAADPQLRSYAIAGGRIAFANHCAACHGAGGQGAQGGYPSLADDDWLWGGDLAAIHTTITHGIRNQDSDEARLSMMPVFGNGILTPAQISDVTEYVLALSERSTNPEATTRGATLFTENCTACHGDAGRGNPEFGAPNLTDRIWLHGAERSQIQASITRPRMGVMPAFNQRLDPAVVNMLAVYVHSLGGGR